MVPALERVVRPCVWVGPRTVARSGARGQITKLYIVPGITGHGRNLHAENAGRYQNGIISRGIAVSHIGFLDKLDDLVFGEDNAVLRNAPENAVWFRIEKLCVHVAQFVGREQSPLYSRGNRL